MKLYGEFQSIEAGRSVRDAMGAKGATGALPAGTNPNITPTANSDSAIAGGAGGRAGAGSGSPASWSTDGGAKIPDLRSAPKPNFMSDAAHSAPAATSPTTAASEQAVPTTQASSDSAASAPPQPAPGGRTSYRPPPQSTVQTPRGVRAIGPLVGSNRSTDPNTYLPPAPPAGPFQPPAGGGGRQVPGQAIPANPGTPLPLNGSPGTPVTQALPTPTLAGAPPAAGQYAELGQRMAGYMGNQNYGGAT